MYHAEKEQDLAMVPKHETRLSLNKSLKKREEESKEKPTARRHSAERREMAEPAPAQRKLKEPEREAAHTERIETDHLDFGPQSNPYQSLRGEQSEKSMTIIHEEDLEETI